MKHLDLSVLLKSFSNWYSINIIKPRPVAVIFVDSDKDGCISEEEFGPALEEDEMEEN